MIPEWNFPFKKSGTVIEKLPQPETPGPLKFLDPLLQCCNVTRCIVLVHMNMCLQINTCISVSVAFLFMVLIRCRYTKKYSFLITDPVLNNEL